MRCSPYSALQADWAHIGATPAACRLIRRWAQSNPDLEGYPSPAAVVEAASAGDDQTRRRIESALLALAGGDAFAARTLLQALLPRLGRAGVPRRFGAMLDQSPDEVRAELVSRLWEAIRTRSASAPKDPGMVLVDLATGSLRTQRRIERRREARLCQLEEAAEPTVELEDIYSTAERLAILLGDAARAGALTKRQALLLMGIASGQTARDAGRALGLSGRTAPYYARKVATERLAHLGV